MNGEDEQFDICEETYPEEATIKCVENRLEGINLTIKAIPCNGIKECRDGEDEDNCEEKRIYFQIIIASLMVITQTVYLYIRIVKKQKWKQKNLDSFGKVFQDNYKLGECGDLKGDDLAKLKVIIEASITYINWSKISLSYQFQNETYQKRCSELLAGNGCIGRFFKKIEW